MGVLDRGAFTASFSHLVEVASGRLNFNIAPLVAHATLWAP